MLGAIIGGIAGGGKGAAIGAGAGAAAGAGVQILTRGSSVNVPAESLLTFRLQQPLQTSTTARLKPSQGDYNRSPAGQADAERGLPRNPQNRRWTSAQDRYDYEAGYSRGYSGELAVADLSPATGTIRVGADNYVTWNAPAGSRVYVSVDQGPEQLFAGTASGSQLAPLMQPGHVYVFILRDRDGREIASDRLDLRSR